jgi:hypothetical protein
MTLRDRSEIQILLKKAGEHRRRIKELQDNLDQLHQRIGRLRGVVQDNGPDARSGRAIKASRKK